MIAHLNIFTKKYNIYSGVAANVINVWYIQTFSDWGVMLPSDSMVISDKKVLAYRKHNAQVEIVGSYSYQLLVWFMWF